PVEVAAVQPDEAPSCQASRVPGGRPGAGLDAHPPPAGRGGVATPRHFRRAPVYGMSERFQAGLGQKRVGISPKKCVGWPAVYAAAAHTFRPAYPSASAAATHSAPTVTASVERW